MAVPVLEPLMREPHPAKLPHPAEERGGSAVGKETPRSASKDSPRPCSARPKSCISWTGSAGAQEARMRVWPVRQRKRQELHSGWLSSTGDAQQVHPNRELDWQSPSRAGTSIPTLIPQRPSGALICLTGCPLPSSSRLLFTFLSIEHDGEGREDEDLTWTPVLREISRSRVIFCRLYTSAAWSAFSLQEAHTGFSLREASAGGHPSGMVCLKHRSLHRWLLTETSHARYSAC